MTLHNDAGGNMRQPHGAVGFVDMLTPGARSPIGIDAQILVFDLDVDCIVDHRIDPHRSKTRMPTRLTVERRNANQPVHAGFRFHPTIGIWPADLKRRRFEAGFFARALLDPFNFVVMTFRPAQIHAHQHFGPVLRFCSAGTRIDFDVAVIAVNFAGEQAFELKFLRASLQNCDGVFTFTDNVLIVFGIAELNQRDRILELLFKAAHLIYRFLETGPLAQHFLRPLLVIPKTGVLCLNVQRVQLFESIRPVKDASA